MRPLIAPLAPNLLLKACFLLLATTRYAALHAEVTPAESTGKPFKFRYEEKRRTGTKSIGSFWKGRKCWAVIRVARAVGGTEDSMEDVLADWSRDSRWDGKRDRTAPCAHVGEDALLGLGSRVFSRHGHVVLCI